MDLLKQVQRRAREMITGLEHLPYESRPRELRLLTPEERRLQENLGQPSSTEKGLTEKLERPLFQGPVIAQGNWI